MSETPETSEMFKSIHTHESAQMHVRWKLPEPAIYDRHQIEAVTVTITRLRDEMVPPDFSPDALFATETEVDAHLVGRPVTTKGKVDARYEKQFVPRLQNEPAKYLGVMALHAAGLPAVAKLLWEEWNRLARGCNFGLRSDTPDEVWNPVKEQVIRQLNAAFKLPENIVDLAIADAKTNPKIDYSSPIRHVLSQNVRVG